MGKANSLKKSLHSSEMNERSPVDMSQEIPPKVPVSEVDFERYIDRPFDLVARVRAAKEAAQREMETFGNVSEYEIRKIYGKMITRRITPRLRKTRHSHRFSSTEINRSPGSHSPRSTSLPRRLLPATAVPRRNDAT